MPAAARGKNEPPAPIIVKKVTIVQGGGHHGGAWKVAYADFVTAMMAFFLLLWLLGATTEAQKKGLADYFTPTLVKTKDGSAGSNNGLLGGSSLTEVDRYPNRQGQTGTRTLTVPRDATGGPKEGAAAIARMREKVAEKLAENRKLQRLMNQVKMVDTTEGIRIDLVDDANFSMFQLGTTIMTPEADALVEALADSIADEGGLLTVRGHTDALQWRSGVGNNWALSGGRAEATRQAFVRHGIGPSRFRRIEGVADREPLVADKPADPRNRRISILLGK
ncbi:flagellar motor protein MotB [Croceibacterium sp. TMG7-5b_MA50]|uniref:flagellar motor protein MotB n=1 Tax=Croceibacterium sp. TMG7-5b_MA50 TaxID=3121290 RepID=UPI003221F06C